MKKTFFIFTILISFAFSSVYACGMQNQYSVGKAVLSESEAKKLSLNYLSTIDDKTIKIKSVETKPEYYVVVVINGDEEPVAELQINRQNGTIRPKF